MLLAHYAHALLPAAATAAATPDGKQIIKFLYMGIQLLLVGSLILARLTVPRAAALSGLPQDSVFLENTRRRLNRTIGVVALLYVPASLLQLAFDSAKNATTALGSGLAAGPLDKLFGATPDAGEWITAGGEWIVAGALTIALAVIGIWLLAAPDARTGKALLAVGAVTGTAMVLIPAVPVSFTGLTLQEFLSPVASQTHILSGSVWVGGLIFLTLLLWPAPKGLAGDMKTHAAEFWPQLWQRFSTLAMIALGLIILSGGWLAWVHVGSISQMFTTAYGIALSVKMVVVAAMVVFGAIHQLYLIPRINQAQLRGDEGSVFKIAVTHFRATVLTEALLGVAVLVIVPLLSGSARKQAAAAAVPGSAESHVHAAVLDGSILGMAAAGAAVMVLLFWASAKVSYRKSTEHVQPETPQQELQQV